MYNTLSEKDKLDLLGKKDSRTYKYVGHSFTPLKGVGKQYCTNCGLLSLNNGISRWCVDKGCNYDVHSSYKSKIKKAGGL